MRVVILGSGGMLGHKLWQVFAPRFDTYVTVRKSHEAYKHYSIFDPARWRAGADVWQFDTVVQILEELSPDVVINAIGIVKQLPEADDPIVSITINSLFPHRLAALCREIGARLIHISTDCVFSGHKGLYTEDDEPDATDLYGRSKLLGEVQSTGCLTVRTSIIGRELGTHLGLVEWLLGSQGQKVKGYVNAIFSGLTTQALAQVLADVVADYPGLSGLYHVSANPISKYDLLQLLRAAYKLDVEIEPCEEYHCNRSLDSSKFRAITGFVPPPWDEMVAGLVNDKTEYDVGRKER